VYTYKHSISIGCIRTHSISIGCIRTDIVSVLGVYVHT